MRRVRIDNGWGKCGKCGHKLFRVSGDPDSRDMKIAMSILKIECKCGSCKEINRLRGDVYDE